MSGIGNDGGLHITCRRAHHCAHHGPKGFLAANRKHRHGQHAFGNEGLVVGGVLIEGFELLETCVHRARRRVELSVVFARRFLEFLGIGRKFVPEPIEIDSLAALHQPLGIGSIK